MQSDTFEGEIERELAFIAAACPAVNLRMATRLVTRFFDQALAPAGILSTQLPILIALARVGEATATALAPRLAMDRTTLTRNLKPLFNAGLTQYTIGDDRRERRVALTDLGRERLTQAVPLWRSAYTMFNRLVETGETTTVVDVAASTVTALREWASNPDSGAARAQP